MFSNVFSISVETNFGKIYEVFQLTTFGISVGQTSFLQNKIYPGSFFKQC